MVKAIRSKRIGFSRAGSSPVSFEHLFLFFTTPSYNIFIGPNTNLKRRTYHGQNFSTLTLTLSHNSKLQPRTYFKCIKKFCVTLSRSASAAEVLSRFAPSSQRVHNIVGLAATAKVLIPQSRMESPSKCG